MKPVAHLVAELEKCWAICFILTTFWSRLADSSALCEFSLGHASFDPHWRTFKEIVRTAMKTLVAGKAKWAVDPVRNLN